MKNQNMNYRKRLTRLKQGFTRRNKFNSQVSRSNYLFPILTDPLIINSTDYSSQNLQLDIASLLTSNSQFIQLSDMYQYFKLEAVALKTSPVQIDGDWPPLAYAYLFGANDLNIQYSAIPRLPAAKLIKNNKSTTLYFKRFGRQDDFNWYKDSGDMPSVTLRIRLSEQLQKARYVFQVKFFVRFNMLVQYGSSKVQEEYQDIVVSKVVNKEAILTYSNEPSIAFTIQAKPHKELVKKIEKVGDINLINKKYEIPKRITKKKQYPGLQNFVYDDSEDLSIEEIRNSLNYSVAKDVKAPPGKNIKPKVKTKKPPDRERWQCDLDDQ